MNSALSRMALAVILCVGAISHPLAETDRSKYLRPAAVPAPQDNAATPARIALGKALFFDPRLSGSGWISCASCHNPALGWSDGLPTAIGQNMKVLGRATPTVLNSAYQTAQFWDGRAATLEEQAVGPITADGEMAGGSMEVVAAKLATIPGYVSLFEQAYPGKGVTPETIAKAIASFERTVVSSEAPFDRWIKGDASAISESAQRGFAVFEGKADCTACHSGFNFTSDGFHNIGIDSGEDVGRYAIMKRTILKGAFKTPTLRDIARTAPYMHNGIYKTLEEVVDHYDRGGDLKSGTDPNIKPLNLTDQEKKDLVEFMKSLTGDPVEVSVPQLPL